MFMLQLTSFVYPIPLLPIFLKILNSVTFSHYKMLLYDILLTEFIMLAVGLQGNSEQSHRINYLIRKLFDDSSFH